MSSKSFANDLHTYVTTRISSVRIGLLWLGLTACALAASAWPDRTQAATTAVLAALLIVQFRLWDDLADQRHDAHYHSQRVLVSTVHGHKFVLLCIALALPIAWALWIWRDPARLLSYAALCAAMGMLYIASPQWPRIVRSHLVLLKYPVFVWLCAINPQAYRTVMIGTALWLVLALIDMRGDRSMRAGSNWRWIQGIELAMLFVLAVLALQHALSVMSYGSQPR